MNQTQILARPRFRILAVPFGGPIPSPKSAIGVDMDDEWFSDETDIGREVFDSVPVLFQHGDDPVIGSRRLGTAVLDPKPTAAGWWATVTWDEHEPAVALVRALATRTPLFGSSQALGRGIQKTRLGLIKKWTLAEFTLSPSPQNIAARLEAF